MKSYSWGRCLQMPVMVMWASSPVYTLHLLSYVPKGVNQVVPSYLTLSLCSPLCLRTFKQCIQGENPEQPTS